MIQSFGDRETQKIWEGIFSSKLPSAIQQVARRKLRMINNAQSINDLRSPPAKRLEKLKGSRKNCYSIRINRQWRITFEWHDNNAQEIKIEDYHD